MFKVGVTVNINNLKAASFIRTAEAWVLLYKGAKYITGFCEEALLQARNAILEADKEMWIDILPMMLC